MNSIAGSDTTATAVRAIFLFLMTNPRVLGKLRTEISESLGAFKLGSPMISDTQARAMPYLQAVVREGLRMHPPVVGLQSKEVPHGGDRWKGAYLPAGTNVSYCYWGMMRRADIWGNDASEFRPERWLDAHLTY